MFRIHLIGARPSYTASPSCTLGELVIGPNRLRFELDLTHWSATDYERQWQSGIMRLVHGATSSALMMAYRGKGADAVHRMWALWRLGDDAYVQPHAVLARELDAPFDARSPHEHVGDRIPVTEQALPLGEWRVQIEQLFAAALRIRWPFSQ
ncbi:MAG TPA: hypothetical protein VGJ18_15255 [Gemmatimonadaceae bacterium]